MRTAPPDSAADAGLFARHDKLAELESERRGGARVTRLDLIRQAVAEFLAPHQLVEVER